MRPDWTMSPKMHFCIGFISVCLALEFRMVTITLNLARFATNQLREGVLGGSCSS